MKIKEEYRKSKKKRYSKKTEENKTNSDGQLFKMSKQEFGI